MTDSGLDFDVQLGDGRVKSWLTNYSHIVSLALLVVFMLYTRLQTASKYLKNGQAYFNGNDAWYHYRQVTYTVNNWPNTMPMDPWTGYPDGTVVGQFGTLFDQVIATVALIVGLGDPSQQTIGAVLVVAPAIIGTLVLIPCYYIGKRLGSKPTGLFAAGILAFLPGTFYFNTLAGYSDHHVAEVLMMCLGLAALMYAITAVERDVVVLEIIMDALRERDFNALSPFVKQGALAGIAVALYMWVWPPGILLVGIFAVFLTVKASIDVLANETPEPTLLMGAFLLSVTTIVMLIPLSSWTFSITKFSLAQVAFSFATALGAMFLIGLERLREKFALPNYTYPISIGLIGSIMAGVVSIVLPSVFSSIVYNLTQTVGLTAKAETRTISEAQPFVTNLSDLIPSVMSEYGVMFFVAIIGILVIAISIYQNYKKERTSHAQTGQYTLFVVWFIFITLAAFTQVRFNYYLAPAVAIGAAYALVTAIELVGIPESVPNLKGYQYVALAVILLLFIPALVYPFQTNVIGAASYDQGASDYEKWEGTLNWMEKNTPTEGNYGGAQNADKLDYYGTYEATDNFKYPEGAYGVMSWWDYGHWITQESKRIPVANPFQQNAEMAANYLLATNATEAEQAVTQQTDETETAPNYVVVDWKMINPSSKLGAPTVFHDNLSTNDLYEQVYVSSNRTEQIQSSFTVFKQRYYESMMVRLYKYHGSAVQPQNVFINYREQTVQTQNGEETRINIVRNGSIFKTFQSTEELESYAQNNTGQVGGIGGLPQERVDALETYRLVKVSESNALQQSREFQRYVQQQSQATRVNPQVFSQNPNWVKVFERVDGATISGTGPANTTVRATVPMNMTTTGETFNYTQYAQTDENGNFSLTVPYSTTGYDEFGPEDGYTNTSVRAEGNYTLSAVGISNNSLARWQGQATVTEAQVIGETQEPTTVTLEPQEPPQQPPTNDTNTTDTQTTPESTTPPDSTEDTSTNDTNTTTENQTIETEANTTDD